MTASPRRQIRWGSLWAVFGTLCERSYPLLGLISSFIFLINCLEDKKNGALLEKLICIVVQELEEVGGLDELEKEVQRRIKASR